MSLIVPANHTTTTFIVQCQGSEGGKCSVATLPNSGLHPLPEKLSVGNEGGIAGTKSRTWC